MDGGDKALLDEVADALARALLGGEIDGRRRALAPAVADFEPERLADMAVAVADEDEMFALGLERDGRALLPIVEQADATDRGRGQDRGLRRRSPCSRCRARRCR